MAQEAQEQELDTGFSPEGRRFRGRAVALEAESIAEAGGCEGVEEGAVVLIAEEGAGGMTVPRQAASYPGAAGRFLGGKGDG